MGEAHPVQRAVRSAQWRVEIKVPVDVEQSRHPGLEPLEPGHDRQGNGAVAIEHQHGVADLEQGTESFGKPLHTSQHLLGVLRVGVHPVGCP